MVSQSPQYTGIWAVVKTFGFISSTLCLFWMAKNPYNEAFDPKFLIITNTIANIPIDYFFLDSISMNNKLIMEIASLWLDTSTGAVCIALLIYLLKFVSSHGVVLPRWFNYPLIAIAFLTFLNIAYERFRQLYDPTYELLLGSAILFIFATTLTFYCSTLILSSMIVIKNLRSRV